MGCLKVTTGTQGRRSFSYDKACVWTQSMRCLQHGRKECIMVFVDVPSMIRQPASKSMESRAMLSQKWYRIHTARKEQGAYDRME